MPDNDKQDLDPPVAGPSEQDDHPDRGQERAQRDRHPEQGQGRADARELGDRVAQVRREHRQDREGRPANAVALADQAGQAVAGREAEASAGLLGDHQRELRDEQDPEQVIAELGAGDRVGGDPTGVVVGEARDDPGTDDREQGSNAESRAGGARPRKDKAEHIDDLPPANADATG